MRVNHVLIVYTMVKKGWLIMNNKQMFVSLFIVYILFVSIFIITAPAFADTNVRAGIIIEINEEDDYVVVEDPCGLIWEFDEIEDFDIGDLVLMVMDDMGTPETIIDDVIIDTIYSGYVAAEVK